MTRLVISSFHPPVMELPEVDPIPAGEVSIVLPALNVVFGAVDLLPEYKVSGQLPGYAMTLQAEQPMPRVEVVSFVLGILPQLEEAHRLLQAGLDKNGPLYGRGQLPPALLLQAFANSIG